MKNNGEENKRKLTKREQIRANKIKTKVQSFRENGFKVKNLTIPLEKANIMAIAATLPLIAVFAACWFGMNSLSAALSSGAGNTLMLTAAFLVSIVIHEGIHGLCWAVASKEHCRSIEFGVTKGIPTPYCTCLEPLSKRAYIIGGLMPCMILGVLPCIVSIFTGNLDMLVFGLASILGAGGDLMIVSKLVTYKSENKEQMCLDHPTEVGLMMLEC